jgi:hypothetical protein
MTETSTAVKLPRDANGFAPIGTNECDAHEECLGWTLCHHAGTEKIDGWCDDEHPAELGAPVWTWCPERMN